MSTLSQQVIIKRVPMKEILQVATDDTGAVCVCVDDIFHEANPSCEFCKGEGVIKAEVEPEWVVTEEGDKKVWVASAQIVFDDESAIFDDGEEPTTNIHAFLSPVEDIKEGDYMIPAGSNTVYIVKSIQRMRNLENDILIDCSIEEFRA